MNLAGITENKGATMTNETLIFAILATLMFALAAMSTYGVVIW